jgi:hypothetical protein
VVGTAAGCDGAVRAGLEDDDKFKTMDTNNDGQISSAEHAAGVTKMFSSMDSNGDGFVTSTEMDTYASTTSAADKSMRTKVPASEKISTMDTNGDGKLSLTEHDSGAASMFTKMDTDGNGNLSHAEMAKGHDDAMKDAKSGKTGTSDAGSGNEATPPSD